MARANSTQSIEALQLPKWLHITKVGDEYYRVIDTSVDTVGFNLGSFQTKAAAQHFAMKVSEARAEVRNRNRLKLRPGGEQHH